MPIHSNLGENWFAQQRALRERREQEEIERQNEEARQNEESNKAFEYLTAEYQLAGKIADAIKANKLSSNSENVYTTDDLAYTIRQKYFPPATEHQINSVLECLERDYTRVAKHVNHYLLTEHGKRWKKKGHSRWDSSNSSLSSLTYSFSCSVISSVCSENWLSNFD